MRALVVTIFVLTAVLLVACASSDEPEPPPQAESPSPEQASDDIGYQGAWLLISGEHNDVLLPIPVLEHVTLVLEAETTDGILICNRYRGPLTVEGSRFRVGEVAIEEEDCGPRFLELESRYLSALFDIDRFEVSGERLLLRSPASELQFERTPPLPTADLVDRRWTLDNLGNGEPLSSVVEVQFILRSDGTFDLETGCRGLIGEWAEFADEIYWTGSRANVAFEACSDQLQAQELRAIEVMSDGFRIELSGDRLTLISRFGETLIYRAAR